MTIGTTGNATQIQIGEWTIDGSSLTARRGRESRALEPRAYKVLRYLADRPGELVTIDELLDAHWTGSVVTPNAVTRVIAHLRKVLGDDAKNPRYIETVPRTGYKCIAQVGGEPDRTGGMRRWQIAAAILLVVIAAVWAVSALGPTSQPSIAVLPFENLTGDPAQDYLGEGISEEIISTLTGIPDVDVSARTESFRFRQSEMGIVDMARELGVSYVVTGSVRRNSNDLRLTVQLIDPETGKHLWSLTDERDIAQLFDGQEAVSRGVARALIETAQLDRTKAPETTVKVPDPHAYELYMRARYVWHRRGSEPLQPAIDMLQEVVGLDPDFAKGWNALATAYLTYPSYSPEGFKTWHLAEDAATKAIELDPGMAESFGVLGTFAYNRFQWAESESLFLEGIRKDPNNATAHYWYGEFLQVTGRLQDAATQLARTIELDPTYQAPLLTIGFLHLEGFDAPGSAMRFEKLWNAGYQTRIAWIGGFLSAVLTRDAAGVLEWIDVSPYDEPIRNLLQRFAAVEHGAVDESLAGEIASLFRQRADYPLGLWLSARLGDFDSVFALAHDRLDRGAHLDMRPFWHPQLRLVEQAEFLPLMGRMGLVDYWKSVEWPAACRPENDAIRCSSERVSRELIAPILGIGL